MTLIEGSIVIAAPVEEVFAYASDWKHWSEWFQGVSDFKPVTEIQCGNGARYSYRAKLLGIPAQVETEITEFRENQGWKGLGRGAVPHTTYWLFESIGTGTRFTYAQEYRVPPPLIGAILDKLFVRDQWRKMIDASLTNLQRHFQARAPV